MYQRILIATDGSELSEKAIRSGLQLAALTGAKVTVLKAVPKYPRDYFEGGVIVSVADIKRIEKQWVATAQQELDAISQRASQQKIKVKTVVVKSDLIAEAIVATAKKQGCDLIVMASHGRKGIKRLLLGSETQHVLTQSTIPVLVLR